MPRISRYNPDTHKLEWVDATPEEHQAWKDTRKASRARSKATKRGHAATNSTEPLEDDASPDVPREPSGPKRAAGGANTRPQSMLAPVLPRIAQSLAIGIRAATNNLTRGQAPMSSVEAVAIAVPAVRIVDRTAAKYIRKTGKVTPNQEDAALIVLTIVVWAAGWLVASLTNKPRQVGVQATTDTRAAGIQDDLFAGSEPAATGDASPRQPAPAPAAAITADEGDLFAGSEPIGQAGAAAAPVPMRARVTPAQAAASEALWQAVTPTDRGEMLGS